MKPFLWCLLPVVAVVVAVRLFPKPAPPAALPGRLQLERDFTGTPWSSSVRGLAVSGGTLRVKTSLKPSPSTLTTAKSICLAASGWVYSDNSTGYEWQGVEVLDAAGRVWVKRLHAGDSCAP